MRNTMHDTFCDCCIRVSIHSNLLARIQPALIQAFSLPPCPLSSALGEWFGAEDREKLTDIRLPTIQYNHTTTNSPEKPVVCTGDGSRAASLCYLTKNISGTIESWLRIVEHPNTAGAGLHQPIIMTSICPMAGRSVSVEHDHAVKCILHFA